MLVEDLLTDGLVNQLPILHTIQDQCSQFLSEAGHRPLYRLLPISYCDVQKIKIRTKKQVTEMSGILNQAFNQKYANLAQRSVFSQSKLPLKTEQYEPFYVFPIDGFQYMYSREVQQSSVDYQDAITKIFETFPSVEQATNMVSDLLKFNYISTNLVEGIEAGAEIIIYNIPCYYAARVRCHPKYEKLVKRLTHKG